MGSMALTPSGAGILGSARQQITYHWVNFVIYGLLVASVFGSLAVGGYCVRRGGNVDWAYKFGIFIKVSCQYKR